MALSRLECLRTVVFASRKGGAGKTTLASNIAVQAERAGAGPVAIIDADPMANLAEWWNTRQHTDTPAFAQVGEGGLRSTLETLRKQGIRLVVIDTPPAANTSIGAIIGAADLVVVPVIPSPNDLWAIGETLELVEGQGTPLVFALNVAGAKEKLTAQAAASLSQHGTVAPVIIAHRKDYRMSMITGSSVVEAKKPGRAAEEIEALWSYLERRLQKGERHGRTAA